jgi:hypothetical protein
VSIHLTLNVNDPDVQDILAWVENRFPEEWVEERASLLERAAKILKVGAEYREANANPRRLAGLSFVADSPSQFVSTPTGKHPLHSLRSESDQAVCK